MIILGIDPGSARIGFGIISGTKKLELLDYGILKIKEKESDKRLLEVSKELSKILKKYNPDVAGIEKIYFSKNVKTGIAVAQTRGAIILEIAKNGIPIKEFSPSEIKSAITGYGLADKKAVAKMTAKILNADKLTGFDDASDALAIAIMAAGRQEWDGA